MKKNNNSLISTEAWWKESVIYQIYPKSFMDSNGDGVGDIQGIISRLDHIKDLGVDIIWLSPVYKSPNADNGYDISDYQDIADEYGTMEDWEELIGKVHEKGMKLIMDLVVNHTSDEHPWFVEAKKDKSSPYRDYFIWKQGLDNRKPNNWRSIFGGSAWEYDSASGEYYLHLFDRKQTDLNWLNPDMRSDIYEMMNWWVDKGVDGFRMDVINLISKVDGLPSVVPADDEAAGHTADYLDGGEYYMNGPRFHEYLQEMHENVLAGKNLVTVGECPGIDVEGAMQVTDPANKELNMVFQFELMDIDSGEGGKWDVRKWDLKTFKEIVSKWQTGLEGKGWNSIYLGNHDQPRCLSRFGDDRNFHKESGKMLATLLMTLSGTPFVYQGDEIGMTNVKFPGIEDYKDVETLNMYTERSNELGESHDTIMERIYYRSRDNARTPMQWSSTVNGGFTKGTPWIGVNANCSTINAEAQQSDEDSIYSYYKKLIGFRKQNKVLVYGSYELLEADHEQIIAYRREYNGKQALVVMNFSNGHAKLTEALLSECSSMEPDSCNYKSDADSSTLKPYEARIYLS